MSVLEGEAGKFVCRHCTKPIRACPIADLHPGAAYCLGWVHSDYPASHRGDPDGTPHSAEPMVA